MLRFGLEALRPGWLVLRLGWEALRPDGLALLQGGSVRRSTITKPSTLVLSANSYFQCELFSLEQQF